MHNLNYLSEQRVAIWGLEATFFNLSSGCDTHTQWFWSQKTRPKEKEWNKIVEKGFSTFYYSESVQNKKQKLKACYQQI